MVTKRSGKVRRCGPEYVDASQQLFRAPVLFLVFDRYFSRCGFVFFYFCCPCLFVRSFVVFSFFRFGFFILGVTEYSSYDLVLFSRLGFLLLLPFFFCSRAVLFMGRIDGLVGWLVS